MTNKDKVSKLILKYKTRLNLQSWNIDFQLEKGEGLSVAEIYIQKRYLKALIKVWPIAFEKTEDLDHIIKHELCHILTFETKSIAYDLLNSKFRTHEEIDEQNEILTETITRLIK